MVKDLFKFKSIVFVLRLDGRMLEEEVDEMVLFIGLKNLYDFFFNLDV